MQLTAFMQRQFTPAPLSLRVQVMTPAERRLTCAQPLFSLPARTRVMGNLSMRMVCGGQTRYLQVSVQVTDRYLVAARPIAARQTLSDDDIDWRTGSVSERVIAGGDGFTLHSLGKALGNGATNDTIRVKMDSGQQVSGTVTTAGQVRVIL